MSSVNVWKILKKEIAVLGSFGAKTEKKCVAKPPFERCQIFNDDLVRAHNKQVNLHLNKPIYVGQAILDLSKWLMCNFHYKVMKPKYGDKINLLFTYTGIVLFE